MVVVGAGAVVVELVGAGAAGAVVVVVLEPLPATTWMVETTAQSTFETNRRSRAPSATETVKVRKSTRLRPTAAKTSTSRRAGWSSASTSNTRLPAAFQ